MYRTQFHSSMCQIFEFFMKKVFFFVSQCNLPALSIMLYVLPAQSLSQSVSIGNLPVSHKTLAYINTFSLQTRSLLSMQRPCGEDVCVVRRSHVRTVCLHNVPPKPHGCPLLTYPQCYVWFCMEFIRNLPRYRLS